MSAPTIPTPQDAALLLQDAVTKTANFNTAAFDLGAGFAPGGLGRPVAAIVHVTAARTPRTATRRTASSCRSRRTTRRSPPPARPSASPGAARSRCPAG